MINSGVWLFMEFVVATRWKGPLGGATDSFRIARYNEGGTNKYYKSAVNNGSVVGLATGVTSDTSGKLRLTRTGTTLRAYYWTGSWTQLGGDETGATIGSDDVFVQFALTAGSAATDGRIDLKNFVINSGTTSNKAGWAREATGANRGTQADMPTNLGVVTVSEGVDLLDLDNNKLWMRFVRVANNIVFTSLTNEPRRTAWDDGLLMIGQGSGALETQEGMGTLVDFTLDQSRIYRETASIPGTFYGTQEERATGAIARRNDALGWAGSDAAWEIPDYRVHDVDIHRASGFEFHAMATVEGVGVGKLQRGYRQSSPTVLTSKSTEVTAMRAVQLDPSTGELFYMDDTTLHSVDKATWEGVMVTTQVFTAVTTKAIPGTRYTWWEPVYHFVRVGTKIYVPSHEGVYMVDWPGGSFVLQYGDADSGAVFPILPVYTSIVTIAHALDGATNVLACGLHSDASSLVTINLDTDTLHGATAPTAGKAPVTIAAY
ncbi:MAG: hypothetical protein ACYTEQ_15880 [Planctomycetota bacterium]